MMYQKVYGAEAVETELVRLPPVLSAVIDKVVTEFATNKGLEVHVRWHDAALWIVYHESPVQVEIDIEKKTEPPGEVNMKRKTVPALIQTRVTVGAFGAESGFNPELVFMPDIVVLTPLGRLVPPPEARHERHERLRVENPPQDEPSYKGYLAKLSNSVESYLRRAWNKAIELQNTPAVAKEFLP